jgi:hypothetical protein
MTIFTYPLLHSGKQQREQANTGEGGDEIFSGTGGFAHQKGLRFIQQKTFIDTQCGEDWEALRRKQGGFRG